MDLQQLSKFQFKKNRIIQELQHGKLQKLIIQLVQQNKAAHAGFVTCIHLQNQSNIFTTSLDRRFCHWGIQEGEQVFSLLFEMKLSAAPIFVDSQYFFLANGEIYSTISHQLQLQLNINFFKCIKCDDFYYLIQPNQIQKLSGDLQKLSEVVRTVERIQHVSVSSNYLAYSSGTQVTLIKSDDNEHQSFTPNNGKGIAKILLLSPSQCEKFYTTNPCIFSLGQDQSVILYEIFEGRPRALETVYTTDKILSAWALDTYLLLSLSSNQLKFYDMKEMQRSKCQTQRVDAASWVAECNGYWVAGGEEGGIEVFQIV